MTHDPLPGKEERSDDQQEPRTVFRVVLSLWPWMAGGLVLLGALAEWAVDGRSFDGGLELYLLSWATLTSVLWWLFRRADRLETSEVKNNVATWIADTDFRNGIRTVPSHSLRFFDQVYGARPLSLKRFLRYCLASMVSVGVLAAAWGAVAFPKTVSCRGYGPAFIGGGAVPEGSQDPWECKFPAEVEEYGGLEDGISRYFSLRRDPTDLRDQVVAGHREIHFGKTLLNGGLVFLLAVFLNFVPDLVSFLKTHALLGWMAKRRKIGIGLALDTLLTVTISLGVLYGCLRLGWAPPVQKESFLVPISESSLLSEALTLKPFTRTLKISAVKTVFTPTGELETAPPIDSDGSPADLSRHVRPEATIDWGFPPGILFYSAFATSVLLWLFVLAWLGSRAVLRLGGGGGFLPRAWEVEPKPFHLMGFLAVIIVSGCYLCFLPFFFS